jgi:hypothetical protein
MQHIVPKSSPAPGTPHQQLFDKWQTAPNLSVSLPPVAAAKFFHHSFLTPWLWLVLAGQ